MTQTLVTGFNNGTSSINGGAPISSDTAFANLASGLANGDRLNIEGVNILSTPVTFAQVGLEVVFIGDAWIKQDTSTAAGRALDNLIIFSGARTRLYNLGIDGNAFGMTSYTGRGEVCILEGNNTLVMGARLTGSAPDRPSLPITSNNVASCVVVKGNNVTMQNIYAIDTGYHVIRNRGDNNNFVGITSYNWESKVFTDDGLASPRPGKVSVRNVYAYTTSALAREAVMWDPDTKPLAEAEIDGLYAEAPNSTHVNLVKFVFVTSAVCRNTTLKHPTSMLTSLRIQQAVSSLVVDNCTFDGGINCDPTVDADILITGKTRLGLNCDPTRALLGDLRGSLCITDGVELRGLGTFGVAVATGYWSGFRAQIGALILEGASGAHLINTATQTVSVDQLSVASPIRVTGGMQIDGIWITNQVDHEVLVKRSPSSANRVYVGTNGQVPPISGDGWKKGDRISLQPISPSGLYEFVCTTPGAGCAAWAASTAYALGKRCSNGANAYVCTTAGTSATSGGPTGMSAGIVDGTVVWDYIGPRAVFKNISTAAA